jgi:hypothetical protein
MTQADDKSRQKQQLAEQVRQACISAAKEGYINAQIAGLCREGAWEAAISAMEMLDLQALPPTPATQQNPN